MNEVKTLRRLSFGGVKSRVAGVPVAFIVRNDDASSSHGRSQRSLCFHDRQSRFQHGVGIQRNAVDALLDQELRELRVVARSLATDADLATLGSAGGDDLGDHLFHGRVALVEDGGNDLTVAVNAEDELRQIVRADAEAIEDVGKLLREDAKELGIARDGDGAVDGRELEQMSDTELADRIKGISVFARVHPAQKLRIVGAYQKQHEVVAMTGDGVNDTPALVKADVGVAMGITGTEVAKEAAKIVIGDDNFATIVAAVEEGRVVYRNIKKVVLYLFSTSVAEVLVLLIALILGYPPPLAAVQILWINLVTEGTVTVNLIMEPAEGDEMQQKPISPREPLLTRVLLTRMAFMTPAIAGSTLGWFVYRLSLGVPFPQVQTETFTVLAVCQWFNVLNCRSETRSALNLSILKNPWLIGGLVLGNVLHAAVVFLPALNDVFHTVPFSLKEVVAIGAVASLVLWVEELRKLIVRRRKRRIVTGAVR